MTPHAGTFPVNFGTCIFAAAKTSVMSPAVGGSRHLYNASQIIYEFLFDSEYIYEIFNVFQCVFSFESRRTVRIFLKNVTQKY